MKLFLNYRHTEEPWGGANNFQKILVKYLVEKKDVIIVRNKSEAEVLFFNQRSRGPLGTPKGRVPSLLFLIDMLSGKRMVMRAINLCSLAYNNNFIHRWIDRETVRAMSMMDQVIFQSAYQKSLFVNQGYTGTKDRIVHNGGDPEVFRWVDRSGKLTDVIRLVSTTMSDRASKRHDLILAFADLKNVEVHHIGKWPKNLDSGKVVLHGTLRHSEMLKIYESSDGFLHPAIKDPCPNVVFEALLNGLPVLYNDGVGSGREIVGDCGVPIEEADLNATLETLRKRYDIIVKIIQDKRDYFTINRAMEEYYQALTLAKKEGDCK